MKRILIILLCFLYSIIAKSTTWNGGAGDNQWSTTGNWDNGIPAQNDDVTINVKGATVAAFFSSNVVLRSLTVSDVTLWWNVTSSVPVFSVTTISIQSSYFYIGSAIYIKNFTAQTSAIVVYDQFSTERTLTATNSAFYGDKTTIGYNPNFYFPLVAYITLDNSNITEIFINLEEAATMEIRGTFYFLGIEEKHYMQCFGTIIYRGDISPVTLYSDPSPPRAAWLALATSKHVIKGKVLFYNLAYSTDVNDGYGLFNISSGVATFRHPGQTSQIARVTGTSNGRMVFEQGTFTMMNDVEYVRISILSSANAIFPTASSLSEASLDVIASSVRLESKVAIISALSIGGSGSITILVPSTVTYLSVFSGFANIKASADITNLYIASSSAVNFQAGSTSCTKNFLAKSGSSLSGIVQDPSDKICGCNSFTASTNISSFNGDFTCGTLPSPPAVPPIDGTALPDGFSTTVGYVASDGGKKLSASSVGLIVGIVVGVVVVLVVVVVIIIIVIRKRNDGGFSSSSSASSRNDVELRTHNSNQNIQQSHEYNSFNSNNSSNGSTVGSKLPPAPGPPRSQDSYGAMPQQGSYNGNGSGGRVPPGPPRPGQGQQGRPQGRDPDATGYKPVPGRNPPSKQSSGVAAQQQTNRKARDQGFSSLDNPWMIDPSELVYGNEIGRGAFGVVYKGQWRKGAVAVKQLLTQDMDSEQSNDFKKEVKLMMNLRPHGNVVQFYGITVDPLAVVCEFLPLGSLLSMLRSDTRIPPDKTNKIIVGIARGMFHLHSEKIIHRDLAARNVLLNSDWEPKITDFGLSRISSAEDDNTTQSNTGPLKWMAPECLQLRKYSKKSDVWAYGITLIEILTRQSPYGNMEAIQVAAMVMYGDLKPEVPSSATPKVKKVMEMCFKNNYADRPDFDAICDLLK